MHHSGALYIYAPLTHTYKHTHTHTHTHTHETFYLDTGGGGQREVALCSTVRTH